MSGPQDEASADRPRRPVSVELAAAILIVGGFVSILGSIQAIGHLIDAGEPVDGLAPVTVGIGVAILVLGILLRAGRAWFVTINVVAVLGFLELTSGSVAGIVLGALDVLVVLILAAERPWFRWRPAAGAGTAPGQPLTPPTASPPTR